MHKKHPIPRVRSVAVRGIAPLEFVMALPLLSLLMVAMTWLGYSVIGQTEVLVEARTKAWKRRFEDLSKNPLVFPVEVPGTGLSVYSQEKDFVVESASKTVKVSPMFDGLPGPEASHTILAGSWDWQAMPLDGPPNWKLYGIAAASGATGSIQSLLSNLNEDVITNLVEGIAEDALKKAIAENDPTGVLGGGSSFDDVGNNVESKLGDVQGGKEKTESDRDKEDAENRAKLAKLDEEIRKTEEEYQKVLNGAVPPTTPPADGQTPPADGQTPPAGEDKDKPVKDRKGDQIILLGTKLKRLQSDRYDISRMISS